MKADLLNSIKRSGVLSKRLGKISISVFIAGLLLTAAAYIARWASPIDAQVPVTLAFIGYILIISSAAVLLVNLLRELSLRFEV